MKPSARAVVAALAVLALLFVRFGWLVSGISPRRAIAFGGFVATALLLFVFMRIRVEIGSACWAAVSPAMNMHGNPARW